MTAATTKPTPRPTCLEQRDDKGRTIYADCSVFQTRAGCGYLSSRTPCKHPVERRRAETAKENDDEQKHA